MKMVEPRPKKPHGILGITMFSDDQKIRHLFRYLKRLGEFQYRLGIRLL
jgi:hypothetical protein